MPLTDHQGTARDLVELQADGTTKNVQCKSCDANGNVLAVWEPDQNGFLTTIDPENATIDHRFGFTARPNQTDAGLVNCLNRWYDPVIASWTTQDPITFQGGDANLYRYCGNDPVNSVDPSGLIIETIWDVGMLAWDIGCAVKNTVETTYHGAATGVHWARGDAEAQAESWKKTKENARELAWNAVDLGVDAASTALPGVPAGGSKAARAVAKGGKEVLEQAPGALNKAKKGADAAKEVAEKVKKGKKGGGRPGHTPGKGHVGKSGPEKTKKFQKKAKKLRDQAQARYDEAVARWEKMSEAARKLRPELHPDNFRP